MLDNSAIVGNKTGVDDNIIAKLAKIKELQERATNEGEAQTAAKLLQKLLIKHKLEMSDIEAVQLNREEPVEEEYLKGSEYGFTVRYRRTAWVEKLAGVVARAHFCNIMVIPGSSSLIFVGRKSDRAVALRIFIYLAAAARELADTEAKKYSSEFQAKYDYDKPDIRGFKTSFLTGFVDKIDQRYRMQRNEIEEAAKLAAEGEARAKREADIENAVAERAEQVEAKTLALIDELAAIPEAAPEIDELVATARLEVEQEVRHEFESVPLEVNPMGLMRLKTAEKDVEEWFNDRRRSRKVGSASSIGGGYRRSHNSAGYSRGQSHGGGISMNGNVLR